MLQFGNRLQYRNFDIKRFNRMNFSTILVAFSPEIPEFTLLTIAPFNSTFFGDTAKLAYQAKYLRMSWTSLDLLLQVS